MIARSLLHGLNDEDSVIAIWKLLFSPQLQKHFGSDWSLDWTHKLAANFFKGDKAAFCEQYNSLLPQVKEAMSGLPKYSIANPPWSMVSLEMHLGMIPWVTLIFDRVLWMLLAEGSALEKRFGEVLPFAFFLRASQGDSMQTAFRVCAPSQAVRSGSEYWLMRAYIWKLQIGMHASLTQKGSNRTFSMHRYTGRDGVRRDIYFETTDSLGRETADFLEFLHDST